MSLIQRVKGFYYGFGMPYNGQSWNDPLYDDSQIGPITLDLANGQQGFFNDGSGLFTANGRGDSFRYTGLNSCLDAYKKCPPLSSIINKKAQCHINGQVFVMNKQGKEATTVESKKIRALFKKPNPLQSEEQFLAQLKIYMQTFGFCIVLPIIPAGFEKFGLIEASSLWNIPPYMIDIAETNKLFYQTDLAGIIRHIKLNYAGQQIDLPLENLIIFKDFVPSFNSLIFPESRICLQQKSINVIISAMESQGEITAYAGSQGIITPDNGGGQYIPTAMDEKEKLQLQNDFRRQYGIRRGQFRYIISPAAIKWQSMGTDPRKLMLIEFVQENAVEICNAYAYPPFLAGLRDSTYNNQNAAEKALYQNAIIPESNSMDGVWNNAFKTEDFGLNIETDFSNLAILQENEKEKAEARLRRNNALQIEFYNNLLTLNRWLELNGEDTLTGAEGKMYYYQLLKLGWQFGANQTASNLIEPAVPVNSNGKHLKLNQNA